MPRVHFVDSDNDLEDRPQRFTRSRRRTRGEQKRTGRARRQVEERTFLRRLVRKGKVDSALVRIHLSGEPLSDEDMVVVRELLEEIAKSGLWVTSNILCYALAGLRSCAEWFVETAPLHAVRKLYSAINEEIRLVCKGCQLLAEILAPKAALAAA